MATVTLDDTRSLPDRADERKRPTRTGLVIRLLITALLLALVLGGLWYFNEMRRQGMAAYFASQVPPPTPVSAQPAEAGPMSRFLDGIGSITAVRQVAVAPEVQGRVTQILFEPGASVAAGDPLVQLFDEPEQADLRSYEAQQKLAQANLERTQRLATRDFAAQSVVDTNQAQLDEALAGIARTRAMIEQKLIKAPFAGRLGIRQVQLGQYASPGTVLVTLTDLDTLYVDFNLPEQTLGQLALGAVVEVRVDAFPGKVFAAELSTIEPQIDPATRMIKLQATLPNPDHALVPGMFANARVVLPPMPDIVTVPETAVSQTLYGDSVFVVKEEAGQDGKPAQKAVQTFVETGPVRDGRIAIMRGVAAGDVVVASGQLKLQNGAPVVIKNDNALAIPATTPVP